MVEEELLSIQEVSRLSRVTSRTLRHYDEIGLLKPTAQSPNGMRQYSNENLIRLQRILLLRELGMNLITVAEVLSGEKSDVVALEEHLEQLRLEEQRIRTLSQTVRKTVESLKGRSKMNAHGMFEGFINDPYAEEAERRWPSTYVDSKLRLSSLTQVEQQDLFALGNGITAELAGAFTAGETSDSESVQVLISRHFAWVCAFWTPNQASYTLLGQMYRDDPRFAAHYNAQASGLAVFLSEAIRIFATNMPS